MTIEIMRGKSLYRFRVNPYNNREIDRKRNVHRARWERWQVYATAEEATAAVLRLNTDTTKGAEK